MNAPLYTTEILRLAASLEAPTTLQQIHGQAEARSPTCGSRVTTAIQLDDAGQVTAISQQVHACAFGQASAALVGCAAVGRSRAEVADALDEIVEWLGSQGEEPAWPGIGALAPARSRPSRHGAIVLPFRALLAALDAAE
jgi:NifU-like protein involved in Fe-S cluster formation